MGRRADLNILHSKREEGEKNWSSTLGCGLKFITYKPPSWITKSRLGYACEQPLRDGNVAIAWFVLI